MLTITLASRNDFAEWRAVARRLIAADVAPENIVWQTQDSPPDLLGNGSSDIPPPTRSVGNVSRDFLDLATAVVQHSDPERFAVLYSVLYRQQTERLFSHQAALDANSLLTKWASSVRRDAHKMKAFVRFRTVVTDGQERYLAWFEPDHFTLEATAPFFTRRFAGMEWGIITPYASTFWDKENLHFAPGGKKSDIPAEDAVEDAWKTYFASIFNPARLKVAMMKSEMPMKYWRNLPEAVEIAPLIRNARSSEQAMITRAATQPPSRHLRQQQRIEPVEISNDFPDLPAIQAGLETCRRCPLYEHATQPVFGEGPQDAEIMFIGEQPGDQEDLTGRPFVGPAGQVFDRTMEKIGLDRRRAYVTNAVKHFKFEPRGKRRLHQNPNAGEIHACKFWLDLERGLVRPKFIVALGASAAQALVGKAVSITKLRGEPRRLSDGALLFVTYHPSYILRLQEKHKQLETLQKFEADLMLVRDALQSMKLAANA